MSVARQATGRHGEDAAAEYLRNSGYRIVARNVRCTRGELDIVAEKAGCLVVVEVRTRRCGSMVRPEDTVNVAKAKRVVRAAEAYLAATERQDWPWRMDVVAVEVGGRGEVVRIDHYQNALADLAADW